MTKIKSDQSQINTNQLNQYKNLLKNFSFDKKETFIKNFTIFKKKHKIKDFSNNRDYYEYLIFYFLYTNFKKEEQYLKELKALLEELQKSEYLKHIHAVFYLLLQISNFKKMDVYIKANNLVINFLIENKLISLFFNSKIWIKDYEGFFKKIDLNTKQELTKNICALFKNDETYCTNFWNTLDFTFFLNNNDWSNLKDILVNLNLHLNNNFQSLEKQKNILNRLNKIFNKLKNFSELISLFNEEEKELFSNILDKLKKHKNDANLLNEKLNDTKNNNVKENNHDKEINNVKKFNSNKNNTKNINQIITKIEVLSSHFLSLFNSPGIKKTNNQSNVFNTDFKKQIINDFSECIKKEYEQKTILELLETLNFFEEYKQYLKPNFSSLISSNNIDHIKDNAYVLIIAIFPRFESIILQLLKNLLNKIEEKASMINRIETITDFLKKEKYKKKENYINFLNFLKFCFYETAGFNLRNKYNHEENYVCKFNWEIDENNTSKFLIVLLFYLLNFFVEIQKY